MRIVAGSDHAGLTLKRALLEHLRSRGIAVDDLGFVSSASMLLDPAPEQLPERGLEDYLADVERRVITQALESTRWNRTAAAKALGISFRALRYRLEKLGLDADGQNADAESQ